MSVLSIAIAGRGYVPNQSAPFDAALARAHLAGTRFADVRYAARTASTNADAHALLGVATALGTTIVADCQTAGVGRKGRRWIAPPGSALLFTAILPEPIAATALWAAPFWIALGVAGGVEECCGTALDLVWPNDLHVSGRKTGGILSVARIAGDDAWVGCGVGLNVARPPADPELAALEPQPVFLDDLTQRPRREALLASILREFDRTFDDLREPAGVASRWERRAELAGTVYLYRNDADGIEREGVAQRIGPHGALIVRDADGERTIDMADVRVTGRLRA
jgi:BirA family biotin operon repressor/biotin-[acetyl-CoA-carboxylase] ligase